MISKPQVKNVDEYLAAVPADHRAASEDLRKNIRAAAPKAEECIWYQMPAFRINNLYVAFGSAAKHCSFFPGASPIADCAKELEGYSTSKGTIRFSPARPLPATLVRKLVKARLAESKRAKLFNQ